MLLNILTIESQMEALAVRVAGGVVPFGSWNKLKKNLFGVALKPGIALVDGFVRLRISSTVIGHVRRS